jgi:type I restriction enzyme, S subunit
MSSNDILYAKIGTIAHVTMGQAPPGSTYNDEKNGLPLIAGAGDLGNIYPQPKRWTTNPSQTCLTGDIIICVRATIGVMNWADRIYCLGRGVASIHANENLVEPEYLYYSLATNVDNLIKVASGSTFIQIKRQDIEDLQIPLPPLPEQRRITAILREADEIRRLRQQANEISQRLGTIIFEDMFGTLIRQETQKMVKLSDLGSIQYGLTVNSQRDTFSIRVPYLRVANVHRDKLDLTDVTSIGVTPNDLEKYTLQNGDILVVEGHANPKEIGRAAVWQDELFGCLHQNHLIRIRPNKDIVSPYYVVSFLNSEIGMRYMQKYAKTSSGLNTINSRVLADMPIFYASLDSQREFTRRYLEHRKQLLLHQQATTQLDAFYQSLLAQAFSGELTASWRKSHLTELIEPAEERDHLLKGLSNVVQVPILQQPDETPAINREELMRELTSLQTALLKLIDGQRDNYFTATRVHEEIWLHMDEQGTYLEESDLEGKYRLFAGLDCSLDTTRRELHFLARMGLVKELTLPVEEESGVGIVHYITAYRSLREDDDYQQYDLSLLNADLVREALT